MHHSAIIFCRIPYGKVQLSSNFQAIVFQVSGICLPTFRQSSSNFQAIFFARIYIYKV